MTEVLKEALLAPDRRATVIKDIEQLIDAEVAEKNGVGGMAVKSGYAVVKKMNSTFVSEAVDSMLDRFVDSVEPFYAQHQASGEGSFADHLVANSSDVADALLGVTDDRAENSRRESVKKAYARLRPQAKKHVEDALPRLGDLIERHMSAVQSG
ncbi:hypothetical protein EF847_01925 [Actinobacteria bacterium YIM 96077]|uniref:Uncharacterized protein n=1 Tax=Phytoactinopolyspora halophila TaxID=1981511 RepID=A0A329QZW9_9ACTN|nr:hypothetical protein [Phytoactinopolyspora halophila]AYY11667.1 hypothetical protein EF847_01925 [Actinobacteria bacterium YIM 96077]RAW17900.1 hypothetical protein DPM12_03355 [Phytoactinopolyspora halophila]